MSYNSDRRRQRYPHPHQGANNYDNEPVDDERYQRQDANRQSDIPRRHDHLYTRGHGLPNGTDARSPPHMDGYHLASPQPGMPGYSLHSQGHIGGLPGGPYQPHVPAEDYGPSPGYPQGYPQANPQAYPAGSYSRPGPPAHSPFPTSPEQPTGPNPRGRQPSIASSTQHPPDPPGITSQLVTARNLIREPLDPRYKVQTNPRAFFKKGRVFSVLWHENTGLNARDNKTAASSAIFHPAFGEPVHSRIRRMVVVKEYPQCAWCFAIYTYRGRGLAKLAAEASKHSIVFNEGTQPMMARNEPRMQKDPLEIRISSPDQMLDPMSRLNFGKLFTVEHNVKVLHVGKITERSIPAFTNYAREELSIQ